MLNASDKLLFVHGLHQDLEVVLQLMPQVFDWIHIWALCWGGPVVDPILLDELHSQFT